MKDVHVVGKKMTRNAGKMAKLIGCAFHFETEFRYVCIKEITFYTKAITCKCKVIDKEYIMHRKVSSK